MFFPSNPNKNKELWPLFEHSLTTHELYYFVIDGQYIPDAKPHKMSPDEAASYVTRLKTLQHMWVGARHLTPMPWHFSVKEISTDTGILNDFIVGEHNLNSLEDILNGIAQLMFYLTKSLNTLVLPWVVELDESSLDVGTIKLRPEINQERHETKIYRINS